MAEFEKAFEFSREDFVRDRVENMRAVARLRWKRGDKFFLAGQHAFHMLAYSDCKCLNHSCGGCAMTLAIASQLEGDMSKLDSDGCDKEEARAVSFWTRKWDELRRWLVDVDIRAKELERQRKERHYGIRARSVKQDQEEDRAS